MTNLRISLDAPTLDSIFGAGADTIGVHYAPTNAVPQDDVAATATAGGSAPAAQDQAATARFRSQVQKS